MKYFTIKKSKFSVRFVNFDRFQLMGCAEPETGVFFTTQDYVIEKYIPANSKPKKNQTRIKYESY